MARKSPWAIVLGGAAAVTGVGAGIWYVAKRKKGQAASSSSPEPTDSGPVLSAPPSTPQASAPAFSGLPPSVSEAEGPPLSAVDERTALARVIHSEAGERPLEERVAVAWVVRNRARAKGLSIARMVCSPKCGRQGGKRPMSSRQAPRAEDYKVADAVLAAPQSADPTGGATKFFEPRLQDHLVKEGRPGYKRTADEVRKRWLRDADYYGSVGVWEFYGPKREAVAQAGERRVTGG